MSINILEDADSLEISKLKSEILSKRSLGNVLFEIKQISADASIQKPEKLTTIIDLFVGQMGYNGLGDRWQEITETAANKIIVFVLIKDLAYSSKIMPVAEAEKIATKIFHLSQGSCKFFTNAVFVNDYSSLSAWDSLTEATFDTGIIFVSDTLIGMLWVKDED